MLLELLAYMEVDLERSYKDSGEGKRYIFGKASTPDRDIFGTIILQRGIDLDYFVNYGFFNWDHMKTPDAVIGFPYPEECYVDDSGVHVAGELLKGQPLADQVWNLIVTLKKNNAPRSLYFSLEGVVSRQDVDREAGIIYRAKIFDVAITKRPANPKATLDALVRSLAGQHIVDIGYEVDPHKMTHGHAALRAESLDEALKVVRCFPEHRERWVEELKKKGDLNQEEALLYAILTCPRCMRVADLYKS